MGWEVGRVEEAGGVGAGGSGCGGEGAESEGCYVGEGDAAVDALELGAAVPFGVGEAEGDDFERGGR